MPVALLAVAVVVPILRWSTLPKDRPGGWLILAMAWGAAGLVVMAPQMWKPRGWAPEQWTGPHYIIGLVGVTLGLLRSKFGPTAAGLFMLAFGAGLSVATTIASTRSSTWRISPVGYVGSFLVAFVLGGLGGRVVRQFGRFVDRDGRYVARPRATTS
ncbi:MAG: hypothetical protein JO148_05820 [Acidimicrobiia bacterium]|nr:hypothetical protein [Acidimicrobiia bacterium]